MRVLLLKRQDRGEFASFIDDLGATLPAFGITAVVHDAGWIPEEVNRHVDREVSSRLREESMDYDLVHAFGYRTAWACAETFGDKEAWLYTAYDAPRTTHQFLVDRLAKAQKGICSSYHVQKRLEEAGVVNLDVIAPGYLVVDSPRRSREDVREFHRLPSEGFLVGASFGLKAGNATRDDMGIDHLMSVWPKVLEEFPDATLALIGDSEPPHPSGERGQGVRGEDPDQNQVHRLGPVRSGAEFISACDLWIEAGRNRGASRTLLCALAHGTPVLARDADGLGELIAPDVSGFAFPADGALAAMITEAMRLDLTREAIGNAGRARYEERYKMRKCSDRYAEAYRGIAERLS